MRIVQALRRVFGGRAAAPAVAPLPATPTVTWTKSYERRPCAASPYGDARGRVRGETTAARTIAPEDRP